MNGVLNCCWVQVGACEKVKPAPAIVHCGLVGDVCPEGVQVGGHVFVVQRIFAETPTGERGSPRIRRPFPRASQSRTSVDADAGIRSFKYVGNHVRIRRSPAHSHGREPAQPRHPRFSHNSAAIICCFSGRRGLLYVAALAGWPDRAMVGNTYSSSRE